MLTGEKSPDDVVVSRPWSSQSASVATVSAQSTVRGPGVAGSVQRSLAFAISCTLTVVPAASVVLALMYKRT